MKPQFSDALILFGFDSDLAIFYPWGFSKHHSLPAVLATNHAEKYKPNLRGH